MLDYEKAISVAEQKCADRGIRFTRRRKQVLAVLIKADAALSAYEIAELCDAEGDSKMPAMSVYRILDFLVSEQLAHKLNSANKYVACSHIACSHAHEVPQFLICGKCQQVKEIAISKKIIDELDIQVEKAGYSLVNSQLELECLCSKCIQQNT